MSLILDALQRASDQNEQQRQGNVAPGVALRKDDASSFPSLEIEHMKRIEQSGKPEPSVLPEETPPSTYPPAAPPLHRQEMCFILDALQRESDQNEQKRQRDIAPDVALQNDDASSFPSLDIEFMKRIEQSGKPEPSVLPEETPPPTYPPATSPLHRQEISLESVEPEESPSQKPPEPLTDGFASPVLESTDFTPPPEPTLTQPAEPVQDMPPQPTPQVAGEILAAVSPRKTLFINKRIAVLSVVTLLSCAGVAAWVMLNLKPAQEVPPSLQPPTEQALPSPASPPVADTTALPEPQTSQPNDPLPSRPVDAGPPLVNTADNARMQRNDKADSTPKARPAIPESRFKISNSVRRAPLQEAYAALVEERWDAAMSLYREALAANPGEIDAMLGLGYIHERQGRNDEARSLYQETLRQQPNHPVASASLLRLVPPAELYAQTSRARELVELQPVSAGAWATLGSVLARESRFAEAQQAYFKASSLEPSNAFHAYNLAVALDRLHKHGPALGYYERAMQLVKAMPAGDQSLFPYERAAERVKQLREIPEAPSALLPAQP